MKQRKIILVLLPLATIILELFPCGAVLNFGRGLEEGGGLIKETYSYFSLLPVGYANFGPFITALLSCVLFVIALLFLFAPNDENPNLFSIGEGFGFFVFFGKQNEGSIQLSYDRTY